MIKAVIFDSDGILIRTEHLQWKGWVEVLKPFGISLSKEQYFEYAGKRGDIIASELIKEFNLDVDRDNLLKPKEKLVEEWCTSRELELMPYAQESIDFFKEKNIKVGVASGAPRDELILKLKKVKLYSLFSVIVAGNEVEKGKPHPDIYSLAAKKIGFEPRKCISFEDTQYGLASAKSAGLICFVIPNEFSAHQEFSKSDKKFRNLKDAVDWIGDNYDL